MDQTTKFWADLAALHAWAWQRIEFFQRERWRQAARPLKVGTWSYASRYTLRAGMVFFAG